MSPPNPVLDAPKPLAPLSKGTPGIPRWGLEFLNHKGLQNTLWAIKKTRTCPQVCTSSCLGNRNSFGECLMLEMFRVSPLKQRVRRRLSKTPSELMRDAAGSGTTMSPSKAHRTLCRHHAPPEEQTGSTGQHLPLPVKKKNGEHLLNPIPKILPGTAAWPSSTPAENLDFMLNLQTNHYWFYVKSSSSFFWSRPPLQQ